MKVDGTIGAFLGLIGIIVSNGRLAGSIPIVLDLDTGMVKTFLSCLIAG